ncbi:MAG: hypothetical protein Ta2A_06460 [Treponemataceae bacterium]|nr:MAG: hypothetical protein Ta2A_06460 [Treponemataceae bacterium]
MKTHKMFFVFTIFSFLSGIANFSFSSPNVFSVLVAQEATASASAELSSSQNDTYAGKIIAQAVSDTRSGGATISDTIGTLERAAKASPTAADRRSLYVFTASLQEQAGRFSDATASYALAAGISSHSAYGTDAYTAEQLAINAVRCALSAGDYQLAKIYLESEVQYSIDPTVAPYVKLYKVWAMLGEADTTDEIFGEPAALLQKYMNDSSMESVRPTMLLMLWAAANDTASGRRLLAEYPASPEAAIVSGKTVNMPTPFWLFLPQSEKDALAAHTAATSAQDTSIQLNPRPAASQSSGRKVQQLGVFTKRDNARAMLNQLSAKGFVGEITEEYRTVKGVAGTYFVVTVNENANGTMGKTLRDAGFDCFPMTLN